MTTPAHPDRQGTREELAAEEWRPVVEFEGCYEVSSHGRVRSLPRRNSKGGLRKLSPNNRGYLVVRLNGNGKSKTTPVHALVATAWHGPRPDGLVCRHLDGVKTNNTPGNLSWGTKSENGLDDIRLGVHYLATRATCSQGHRYTTENTLLVRGKNGRHWRQCRTCALARDKAHRERRPVVQASQIRARIGRTDLERLRAALAPGRDDLTPQEVIELAADELDRLRKAAVAS